MMTRLRRDAEGASVVEYALLMALVLLIVFASVYALGRTPEHPASVLGDTFNRPPGGVGPGTTLVVPTSTTSTSSTTTTAKLPP